MSDTKNVWHRSAKTIGIETRELGKEENKEHYYNIDSLVIEAIAMDDDNISYDGFNCRQSLSESINEYNPNYPDPRVCSRVEYIKTDSCTRVKYEKIGGIAKRMERYDNHRRAALKLAKYYQIKFADIHGVANNAGNGYNWILLGDEYDMDPRKG